MDSHESVNHLENDCIDFISSMPDSILGKILSHLPTKNAVATSILSTRWKNLFPLTVMPIKIDITDLHHSEQFWPVFPSLSFSFMNFVDKLLNETLRHVSCVEKIVFHCVGDYSDSKIVSWLCAALRLNVAHIGLTSYLNDSRPLFHSLNGCMTLVELELGNNFKLCVPEGFVLPNLKRLWLHKLVLGDDKESICRLLYGCPLLDDLMLSGCYSGGLQKLQIRSPLLKKLFMENFINQKWCKVEIDAPNLEAFVFKGSHVEDYVVADFKSLHSVCIEFDSHGNIFGENHYGSNVCHLAKLVKACSSTIRLCLSGNSITILHRALHRASIQLPVFENLTCLALGRIRSLGFEMLARLLKTAPSLQTLKTEVGFEKYKRGYERFESLLPTLPVCVELSLKKIEFWEFKGKEDAMKLVEYFLKNGRVMQEVKLHYLPCADTSIFNRLVEFPRHSEACQIILRENDELSQARFSRANWF